MMEYSTMDSTGRNYRNPSWKSILKNTAPESETAEGSAGEKQVQADQRPVLSTSRGKGGVRKGPS